MQEVGAPKAQRAALMLVLLGRTMVLYVARAVFIPLSLALQWTFGKQLPFQNRTGIVFWACIAVCILISLATKPPSGEQLKGLIWTRDSLRLPPEERERNRGVRRPFFWWVIINAMVVYFYVRYA